MLPKKAAGGTFFVSSLYWATPWVSYAHDDTVVKKWKVRVNEYQICDRKLTQHEINNFEKMPQENCLKYHIFVFFIVKVWVINAIENTNVRAYVVS